MKKTFHEPLLFSYGIVLRSTRDEAVIPTEIHAANDLFDSRDAFFQSLIAEQFPNRSNPRTPSRAHLRCTLIRKENSFACGVRPNRMIDADERALTQY